MFPATRVGLRSMTSPPRQGGNRGNSMPDDAGSLEGVADKAGICWRRFLPFGLIAAAALVVFALGWHRYLSIGSLIEHRAALAAFVEAHFATALAGFALLYVATTALSVPGAVFLTIAGGLLFGAVLAGLVVVVAATLGATIIFLAARSSLGAALTARAGPRITALTRGFCKDAFNYLLFLRLVPLFPFWLVNLVPALAGVRLSTFVAATAIGILPGTFAFACVGAGLDSVLAAQQQANAACLADRACEAHLDPGALLTPGILFAFAALGVAALVPVLARHLRRRGLSESRW